MQSKNIECLSENCRAFYKYLIVRHVQIGAHFSTASEMVRIAYAFSNRWKRGCYKLVCISRTDGLQQAVGDAEGDGAAVGVDVQKQVIVIRNHGIRSLQFQTDIAGEVLDVRDDSGCAAALV